MTPQEARDLIAQNSMYYTVGQSTVGIDHSFNLMLGTVKVMDGNNHDMRQSRPHEGTVEFTRKEPDSGQRITERFRYDYIEPATEEGIKLITDEVIAASLLIQYAQAYRDSTDHEIVFVVKPVSADRKPVAEVIA